jgi:hypothetical protein
MVRHRVLAALDALWSPTAVALIRSAAHLRFSAAHRTCAHRRWVQVSAVNLIYVPLAIANAVDASDDLPCRRKTLNRILD